MTDHRCSQHYQSRRDADGLVAVMLRQLELAGLPPAAFIPCFETLSRALRGITEVCDRTQLSDGARGAVTDAVYYAAKVRIGGTR